MQKILKRLEMIKTSITIEDQEIIELQIAKLKSMSIDKDIANIIDRLIEHDYIHAISQIDAYLTRYSGMIVYDDKEIGALKMELKTLEQKLQELSEEKSEYLNELNDFNVQYNLHLGEIIRKILELKKEIYYKKTIFGNENFEQTKYAYKQAESELNHLQEEIDALKNKIDQTDMFDESFEGLFKQFELVKKSYDTKRDEFEELQKTWDELNSNDDFIQYEEVKKDYENFNYNYQEIIQEKQFFLDEEALAELKKLYRKASKLCHPDMVTDELQEQALVLMQRLNDAYSKKDLNEIKQILEILENGGGFKLPSDRINDKNVLKVKIQEIKVKITEITKDIEVIRNDETFIVIQTLENRDNYFATLKSELIDEYYRLEKHLTEHMKRKNIKVNNEMAMETPYTDSDDDSYWTEVF